MIEFLTWFPVHFYTDHVKPFFDLMVSHPIHLAWAVPLFSACLWWAIRDK